MKDFDTWNREKKAVDSRARPETIFWHEREVWWCALGVNVGVETDGKHENFERPLLIVKKFNADMFWALPLTSREHRGTHYVNVHYEGGTSTAMLSQIRTVSTKRLIRKIGMIPEPGFDAIRKKLRDYLL
jgi:mRNA interferase MazF